MTLARFLESDIIYGMKEWYAEKKNSMRMLLREYGKVFVVVFLVIISFMFLIRLYSVLVPSQLEVSFLDVGQGDAIFIHTPHGHTMLVDGGVDSRVLERLAKRLSYFDTKIDVMVATHADADHITGLIPVLKKYDVSHVVMSPLSGHTGIFYELTKQIENENTTSHVAKEGDEIIFDDGVTARILYPESTFHGNEKDTNDASVCILITYGSESILLTGDLPSAYERKLISEYLPHHVTIYKAGHHGSKYSSGDVLLSYIQPEYAVISAGKDNRYGHPNPEAVGRLETYSQEILSTIDKGTITFLLDGQNVELETSK
jgi:competence protein ComEC